MFFKFYQFIILGLLAFAVGCSNSSSQGDDLYASAEDDFLTDADFIVDGDDDLFLDSDLDFDPLFDDDEEMYDEFADFDDDFRQEEAVVETQPVISEEYAPGIGEYRVEKGDTLLLIAFNLYGDYKMWRSLSDLNGGITHISEGEVIQYEIPQQDFSWNPQGNPHLIRKGETLGTISHDKYGTSSRWKSLYENNQPMIQDPNLIFAGFTLYYIPDRNVASDDFDI